jgi:hypothetical protein
MTIVLKPVHYIKPYALGLKLGGSWASFNRYSVVTMSLPSPDRLHQDVEDDDVGFRICRSIG